MRDDFIYFTYHHSKSASDEIQSTFPNTKGILCDFKDEGSIQGLCQQMLDMNLDILINNAYTSFETSHFHKLKSDQLRDNFCHNILPTIQITQQAISHFRKKKFGKIINVTTSFLINKPPVGLSSYVAEKAYIASLSKSWAAENASFNITSNCVAPAMMLTPFTSHIDERVIDTLVQSHPLKRLLTVEETAETIHLLLKAPAHINGATWVINGGVDVI